MTKPVLMWHTESVAMFRDPVRRRAEISRVRDIYFPDDPVTETNERWLQDMLDSDLARMRL